MPADDVQEVPETGGTYLHTIDVRWSDCDPARIAYTGRIPCFALEAIDAWWVDKVGHDWYRLNIDCNVGTPFVHLRMDFRAPVTPRHPLICEVALTKLGRRTITFRVVGRQNGKLCFEGEFVSVFVIADSSPRFRHRARSSPRLAAWSSTIRPEAHRLAQQRPPEGKDTTCVR